MAIYGNGEWVSGYHNGQLYLNRQLAKDRNKDLDEIRSESARFLTRMSGVTNAWTINDVIDRRATDNPEATRRNTVVDTAGDVFVAIAPGWQEVDDDSDTDTPQTTLRAATTVAPAFILAPGIRKQTIDSPTDARVLAPTVAGILRIRSPNGAALPRLRFCAPPCHTASLRKRSQTAAQGFDRVNSLKLQKLQRPMAGASSIH